MNFSFYIYALRQAMDMKFVRTLFKCCTIIFQTSAKLVAVSIS